MLKGWVIKMHDNPIFTIKQMMIMMTCWANSSSHAGKLIIAYTPMSPTMKIGKCCPWSCSVDNGCSNDAIRDKRYVGTGTKMESAIVDCFLTFRCGENY